MTDPTHAYYSDLVAAFATLGIDISLPSRTVSVVIGTRDIAIVRQRLDTDGGLVVAGDRIAEARTEIALRYDKKPCTCMDGSPAPPGMTAMTGRNPACPQHGWAT